MKRNIILIVFILSLAQALHLKQERNHLQLFNKWKATHRILDMKESEAVLRLEYFKENADEVEDHNSDPNQTYKLELNQFAVYSNEEFGHIYLNPGMDLTNERSNETSLAEKQCVDKAMTIQVDWVKLGKVSKVKHQQNCQNCWAFSAVGACESWSMINNNNSVLLSEQQISDCSKQAKDEGQGCKSTLGGDRIWAFNYIKDFGLATDSAYPWMNKDTECKFQGGDFKIKNINRVRGCSELLDAIKNQPISILAHAQAFQLYDSGVFNGCPQNASVDHAVLLVGVVNGAWKIKNSWGETWGEKGYIRLAPGNTCSIYKSVGYYPS